MEGRLEDKWIVPVEVMHTSTGTMYIIKDRYERVPIPYMFLNGSCLCAGLCLAAWAQLCDALVSHPNRTHFITFTPV